MYPNPAARPDTLTCRLSEPSVSTTQTFFFPPPSLFRGWNLSLLQQWKIVSEATAGLPDW